MSALLWMSLGAGFVLLIGLSLWFWRRWTLSLQSPVLSLVSRQHIDLFNGNPLDEGELEAAKETYGRWLYEGSFDKILASLTPGLPFVVRVRALAELGTEEACVLLEQQLERPLTRDAIEQSWYWIDIAHCLRMLAREKSLPLLLRRLDVDDTFPLVHFYAAEIVTFSRFQSALREFPDVNGQSAVRCLHRAFEGFRCGISPRVMAEARLGEMVETVWDDHQSCVHPLLVRLFAEALRHLRRAQHFALEMEEPFEQEAYRMQYSRLAALEDELRGYLDRAKQQLPDEMFRKSPTTWRDWFEAFQELRADAGEALMKLLRDAVELPGADQAILALGWSKADQSGPFLRTIAAGIIAGRPLPAAWARTNTARRQHDLLGAAALVALRHHPCAETEQLLLEGARSLDPTLKRAAISSLGWWEPLRRHAVLMYLQDARFDQDADIRQAARSALARLGERQSLQWFRQGLASTNRHIVLEAIHTIAQDGITLLWPELDQMVDEEEHELASCAREALEQMQEELERDY